MENWNIRFSLDVKQASKQAVSHERTVIRGLRPRADGPRPGTKNTTYGTQNSFWSHLKSVKSSLNASLECFPLRHRRFRQAPLTNSFWCWMKKSSFGCIWHKLRRFFILRNSVISSIQRSLGRACLRCAFGCKPEKWCSGSQASACLDHLEQS